MKKTYHGQSDTFIAYCIRATVVSIVILGSAIFLSANARPVSLHKSSPINTTLQQYLLPATTLYYYTAEGTANANGLTFGPELFLKGTINKRPGFSKPGLI